MSGFAEIFNNQNILFVMKVGSLFFAGFYIVFAGVIVRQVNKMTDTLEVGFEAPIRFLALAHFLVSIAVFLLAFVIL